MTSRQARSVVLFIACLSSFLAAQNHAEFLRSAKDITSRDQADEWLTFYYQHPRPDLLVPALRFMSKDGWLKKNDSQAPVVGFLARVFAANPERLDGWITDISKDEEDEKWISAVALWMADRDDCRGKLTTISKTGSADFQAKVRNLTLKQPADLLKSDISGPSFLDALWGSFFASGDERYVQRLISVLPLRDSKDDTAKLLVGGAAQWSLTSNAIQHPKVMEICEAELAKLPNDQKPRLKEIIEAAREKKK